MSAAERRTSKRALFPSRGLDLLAAGTSLAVVLLTLAGRSVGTPAPAAEAAPSTAPSAAPRGLASAARGGPALPPAPKAGLEAYSCDVPDLGLGDYQELRLKRGATLLVRAGAVRPDGSFDLLLHFHGGVPVRRVLTPLARPLVIATIDRGDSSGDYAGTITDRASWDDLLAEIDRGVSDQLKRPAKAERVAVSSFSAGFEASRQALSAARGDKALTGVLLFDSLYGSFSGASHNIDPAPLAPFEDAARRALTEPRFVFALTHSEVKTDGYASTAEVADALLDRLVVRSQRVPTSTTRGLTRIAEERGFFLRGYAGADKDAHCAHLGLVPELVDLWLSRT